MESTFVMILALLFSYNSMNMADDSDEVLARKAERWIAYSIHQGERYSYRTSSPVGPLPPEPKLDTKNSVLEEFRNGSCLDPGSNSNLLIGSSCCGGSAPNSVKAVLDEINKAQALIMGDLERWQNTERLPKWVETALWIRDVVGWNHFDMFSTALLKNSWTDAWTGQGYFSSAQAEKQLPAKSFVRFCDKTDKDAYAMMVTSMRNLNYAQIHDRLKPILESGKRASTLLFHIVLYEALLKALVKGKKTEEQEIACHEGMPSRDYAVYWLTTMVGALKKHFAKQREAFHKKTESREKDNWNVKTIVGIWAKYGPHWDQSLKSVEKMGIQGLDEGIDLFGKDKI